MGDRALTQRAVFLDRDGVVNDAVVRAGKPYPPAGVADLRIAADAPDALKRLRAADFRLIVVTNQPDVARGTQQREAVDAMHAILRERLPLDAVYACFHDDVDHCLCRKPAAGLLLAGAREFALDLGASYLIGDRWRDIDAGWAAGVTPLLIDYGYTERAPERAPAGVFPSLKVAVDWILK